MIAVGCDPSSKHLALAVEAPKLGWEWEKYRMPTDEAGAQMVRDWLSSMKEGSGPFHFVCEQQYLHRNVKTTVMLGAARGRIEAWAMSVGFEVHPPVMPQSWQGPTLGLRAFKGVRSKERKEAALRVASAIVGEEITDDDIADAICISHWFRGRLEAEARFESQRS